MRAHFLALSILAAVSGPAMTQAVAADAENTFMSNSEIQALMAKAKAERKPDQANYTAPILSLAPYRAQLEYRMLEAPAAVHEKDAEMMVVLDGTGVVTTGGKLVNEKRNNADNLGGTSITGGQSRNIAKGDVLIVPQGSPHQLKPTQAPLVLMTLHVPRPAQGWK
jgi:mannose-6-phosphate isomerase-like protein (cupin superfamily)